MVERSMEMSSNFIGIVYFTSLADKTVKTRINNWQSYLYGSTETLA